MICFFLVNTKELTIDNFTFLKEPIGPDDPEKEIIRDAKRMRVNNLLYMYFNIHLLKLYKMLTVI